MPLWVGTQRQKEFWIEIGEWLERVDDAREDSIGMPGMDVDVNLTTSLLDSTSLGLAVSGDLRNTAMMWSDGAVDAERIRT